MKKKKIFYSVLLVLLISILSIAGTLAYLTDTDDATNTFTVGNVAIDLSEPMWDTSDRAHAKIIPGKIIEKDPTVTVLAGSEPSYVRVKVTILPALKAILENLELNTGWTLSKTVGNDYYFEYAGSVLANTKLIPVFDEVKIIGPGVNNATLAALTADDLKIMIVGQAIQSANFTNQAAAWVAFDAGL